MFHHPQQRKKKKKKVHRDGRTLGVALGGKPGQVTGEGGHAGSSAGPYPFQSWTTWTPQHLLSYYLHDQLHHHSQG